MSADGATRNRWHGRAAAARASIVRLNYQWSSLAPSKPVNQTSAADPRYNFTALDRAVIAARSKGLRPMITIYSPPAWARGSGCGSHAARCKPNPKAFGKLGKALARRYSGNFGVLPRVKLFQAWNEPNLSLFLAPQWRRGKPVGAIRYRKMVNAFRSKVRSVHRSNKVISAGTAPFGEPSGRSRTRPVEFWRHVFCLNRELKRKCIGKARVDALAHHAINPRGGPKARARHRDDAAVPDLNRVRRVLRAAERRGTAPGGRHPMWMTEMWWETKPPDKKNGVKPAKQARHIVRTLYEVWRDGAKVAINYMIRDEAMDPANPSASWQSGLYFHSGQAKPALRAFRFPFLARGKGKRKVAVWGRTPRAGKLRIQRHKGGRWKTVKKRKVGGRKVFRYKVRGPAKAKWRAKLGKTKSLAS